MRFSLRVESSSARHPPSISSSQNFSSEVLKILEDRSWVSSTEWRRKWSSSGCAGWGFRFRFLGRRFLDSGFGSEGSTDKARRGQRKGNQQLWLPKEQNKNAQTHCHKKKARSVRSEMKWIINMWWERERERTRRWAVCKWEGKTSSF